MSDPLSDILGLSVHSSEIFEDENLSESHIKGFEIISLIGFGSFGHVLKATRTINKDSTTNTTNATDDIVALKVLSHSRLKKIYETKRSIKGGLYSDTGISRVHNEINVLSLLSPHSNILRIYEVIDRPIEDSIIMVMEICDTILLKCCNDSSYTIPKLLQTPTYTTTSNNANNANNTFYYRSSITAILFADICNGLVHLHQCGIVHRDLKPDNMLICCSSIKNEIRLKIGDFGCAQLLHQESSSDMDKIKVLSERRKKGEDTINTTDTKSIEEVVLSLPIPPPTTTNTTITTTSSDKKNTNINPHGLLTGSVGTAAFWAPEVLSPFDYPPETMGLDLDDDDDDGDDDNNNDGINDCNDVGKYAGRPVDCWALGCTLFSLLHLRPPFYSKSGNAEELFDMVLSGLPNDNEDINSDSDGNGIVSCQGLNAALDGLLKVDPVERWTATDVLEHAINWRDTLISPPPPLPPPML